MSFSHTVSYTWSSPQAANVGGSIAQTGDGEDHRTLTLADSTDGQEVDISWTNANLKSLFIYSDYDVTLFSNVDGGAGNDTVNVKGGKPIVYQANSGHTNPFATANVTKLYADNASGHAAMVELRVLVDSTP